MHRYKYALIFLATILGAWAINRLGIVESFAGGFAETNRVIFVFIAGALYSFSFTAAIAVVLFSNITIVQGDILPLSIIAACGQLLMDVTLLRFLKGFMDEELSDKTKRFVARITNKRPMQFLFQIIGAVIIISPLPEELGLTFLGISHLSYWRILMITYVLDIVGAYLIITLVATIV